MKNFDELLKKYADFIVRVGVNPQPGQVLIINCALEGAPLARLCVRSAFEAGARDVQVNWTDDAVTRTRMELGSEEALTDHKGWQLRRYLDYAETEGGVCVLHLIADDPEVFAGLDGAKISRVNSANRAFMQPWREYTMNDRVQWSIAAIPSAPWAKKMFPELDTDAAIEALWQLIFDTCRVTGGDPVGEWQEHLARLSALRDKMNALDLESVHFASGNGTDLTVGIADQAVWESAASKNEKGVTFLPNIPTEEVFTAPHKDKVNGVRHQALCVQRPAHQGLPRYLQGWQGGGARCRGRCRPAGPAAGHRRGCPPHRRGGTGARFQPHQPLRQAVLQHPV